MPYLNRNHARIYFETLESDRAEWVTLINGHTRGLSDFRHFSRYLNERGWSVLAFDNRGSGKSAGPNDFDLQDIVGDVLALWEKLDCQKSHVLGISFGGAVTLSLAHFHSQRLRSQVLVSTATQFDFARAMARGEKLPDMVNYVSQGFADKNPLLFKALVKDSAKAYSDPNLGAGSKAQQHALDGFNADPWLPKIRLPTLVIHGQVDGVIDVKKAEAVARQIPGAELITFPEVGHLILAEQPRKLYETAEQFFAKVDASRA